MEPYFPGSVVVANPLRLSMYSLMTSVQILSNCSKSIFEEEPERSFRVKETQILTQQRCFFRTVVHHFYVLLAFCIKSLFLATTPPSKLPLGHSDHFYASLFYSSLFM